MHIWRGLMKPNNPVEGIAAQPVVAAGMTGAAGIPVLFHTAGEAPRGPHFGQALRPWVRRTFSATRICSAREAVEGLPTPPLEVQVAGLNCRPP